MPWTAVIPLKAEPLRKSRLSPAIDLARRIALSEELYRHVAACIVQSGMFADVITLSPSSPSADVPVRWWPDEGGLINAALARVREAIPGRLMVINADLPLLQASDLAALAAAAEIGRCAVAADRHALGTNAVALLPDVSFCFSFGPDSLDAHLRSAPGTARVVERTGLAYDIDTMADIEAILHLACRLPPGVARCLGTLERCS
ncbi:MAG: 2-phospho-L-lactate guanylyltransferase [Rhizomicrobium sp.]